MSLASTVGFNVSRELSKMYEKPSASNKVFLKKLLNLKIADSGSVAGHLNKVNMLTSQLESVEINFEDKIRALVLLSSLSETWDRWSRDSGEQFLWDRNLEV